MSKDLSQDSGLEMRLASMKQPSSDPDCLYHAITLTADDDLKVIFGNQTEWVGWTEDGRHEIRQSRLVYADFIRAWELLGQPYCFVHTRDELMLFLVAGGNALVERNLAERIFTTHLAPHPSIPDGPVGYKSPDLFEKTAFRRAPTPRLRMQIFDRDDRRCRICGRRPDDNLDLVLHVHHIRPWEKGGVTDPANLITLCHTCHSGLAPHEDHRLFGYISPPADTRSEETLPKFLNGVSNYRKAGFLGLESEIKPPPKRRRTRRAE